MRIDIIGREFPNVAAAAISPTRISAKLGMVFPANTRGTGRRPEERARGSEGRRTRIFRDGMWTISAGSREGGFSGETRGRSVRGRRARRAGVAAGGEEEEEEEEEEEAGEDLGRPRSSRPTQLATQV